MSAGPGMAGSPSGVLVIDKPAGLSSMGVCRGVRRRLIAGGAPRRVRVGHAGTLDPLATGVLVVMVGRATRQSERLMAGAKEYVADVDLSAFSTTDDAKGERTAVEVASPPDRATVEGALRGFVGVVMQRPPAFSAIHVGGQRAYRLARRGAPPELPARPVTIHAVELIAYEWPVATIRVTCGKGTYIRSLARDLGLALGTGGSLSGLRRTAVGEYTIDRAVPLDALPAALTAADLLPVV